MSSWPGNGGEWLSAEITARVRRARADEPLEAVADLQRQSFTRPWSAAQFGAELRDSHVARLYVLELGRNVPGAGTTLAAYCACWLILDELHINSLAVMPSLRRRGYARTLLLGVLHDVAASGASSATLEVRRSNTAALALYGGLGFHVEGVRADYYEEPREDALVLWHRALGSFVERPRLDHVHGLE
jgi:ribosomal-protein-alanine N-acetyltransferase